MGPALVCATISLACVIVFHPCHYTAEFRLYLEVDFNENKFCAFFHCRWAWALSCYFCCSPVSWAVNVDLFRHHFILRCAEFDCRIGAYIYSVSSDCKCITPKETAISNQFSYRLNRYGAALASSNVMPCTTSFKYILCRIRVMHIVGASAC